MFISALTQEKPFESYLQSTVVVNIQLVNQTTFQCVVTLLTEFSVLLITMKSSLERRFAAWHL